jgi:membrane-bound lytic murein transglycosylase D
MRRYLERAGRHLPMAQAIAEEYALPKDLAYLFMLESGGTLDARSPANALGMWQFMPATARNYGLRVDSWVDERLDPEKSTRAAMLYLKDLYGLFGCWRLAVSAYNSGENKLSAVLSKEDAKEYDEICTSGRLRRETREFWPRFQALAHIAKNPERYGFRSPEQTPYKKDYALVPVEGSYSIATLARLAGVPSDQLARMNPALIRGVTPPEGAPYALKTPLEKREQLVARLKTVPEEKPEAQIVHVVHKGDSIRGILKRYKVEKAKLAGANPDVNLRKGLRQGAKIVVPVRKKSPKTRAGSRDRV